MANRTLNLALALYDSGCSVMPVRHKRPVLRWKRWQTVRPQLNEVMRWFQDPANDVGLITGELSGVVVVDADDPAAVQAVRQNCDYTGVQRATYRGRHFYYRHPGYRVPNTVRCLNQRIDVRGDGGFVVVDTSLQGWGDGLPKYDPFWLQHAGGIKSFLAHYPPQIETGEA